MKMNFLKLQLFIVFLTIGSISKADQYSLVNVSQYLTKLKFLKADFSQTNPDDTISSGTILIKRPGRMRFEYNRPDKTLVLVSAGALAIFDPKGDQKPITYPIKNNPISLILKDEVDLVNSGIVENRVIEIPNGLPASALIQASNYINARLANLSMEQAQAQILNEIKLSKCGSQGDKSPGPAQSRSPLDPDFDNLDIFSIYF